MQKRRRKQSGTGRNGESVREGRERRGPPFGDGGQVYVDGRRRMAGAGLGPNGGQVCVEARRWAFVLTEDTCAWTDGRTERGRSLGPNEGKAECGASF